jgi:NAD+ synthase (glutamine-hydrolysing)
MWGGVVLVREFDISQSSRSSMQYLANVISGGALSPRGDWRAPSDGTARVWLAELEANVP